MFSLSSDLDRRNAARMIRQMASQSEQIAARAFRMILTNQSSAAQIEDSEELQQALSALDIFVPQVLGEVYPKWRGESLDGIIPVVVRKTADREIEIFGLCFLISDGSLTPIHLRLHIALTLDEVAWLECRLGQKGPKGMIRRPAEDLDAALKRLYLLDGNADLIDWVYKVTFGEKRDL